VRRHVRRVYLGTARSQSAGLVCPLAGCSSTLALPKTAVQAEEPEEDRQLDQACARAAGRLAACLAGGESLLAGGLNAARAGANGAGELPVYCPLASWTYREGGVSLASASS